MFAVPIVDDTLSSDSYIYKDRTVNQTVQKQRNCTLCFNKTFIRKNTMGLFFLEGA